MIELGYEVTKLKNEVEKMKQTNAVLKSKVANGVSASELFRMAGELNMKPPARDKVVFVTE